MNPRNPFRNNEEQLVISAIRDAERHTSGEIRVHIERQCDIPLMERTVQVFNLLDMDKTELHSGVLLYVSLDDRKFAILADSGINSRLGEKYWDKLYVKTTERFRNNSIADGLIWCIQQIAEELSLYFPILPNDINELSDEISYGS